MQKQWGIVLLVLGSIFLSLHSPAQTTENNLFFFPDTVMRGEPFVAYSRGGKPPKRLTFNSSEESPRQFDLEPVRNCGYLKRFIDGADPSAAQLVEPEILGDSANCYIMPTNALGGNPAVENEDKSLQGVLKIVGHSLPRVVTDEPGVPLTSIPNDPPQVKPYDVLLWVDQTSLVSELIDSFKNPLIASFVPQASDIFNPVLAGNNLAPTCNGHLSRMQQFSRPFGYVSIILRQLLKQKHLDWRTLADVALHYKNDPGTSWSQPQIPDLGGTAIKKFPPSLRRPSLPSKWALSANSGNLAIVDSGISNFSRPSALKPGLNTLDFTQAPTYSPNTADDFDNLNVVYHLKPGQDIPRHVKYHGSVVAEIAAGKNGIYPFANVIPVKVCDDQGKCPIAAVIPGVCYAINAVKESGVINMSLGGDTESDILTAIINEAADKSVYFTASTGNDEQLYKNGYLGMLMQFPAATQHRQPGELFANNIHPLENMIGVGAVGKQQKKWYSAEFSQHGKYVDIAAPGVNLMLPEISDGYYGTSFASPFVAGAILLAERKGLSPSWVLGNGQGCTQIALSPPVSEALGCGILDLRRLPR